MAPIKLLVVGHDREDLDGVAVLGGRLPQALARVSPRVARCQGVIAGISVAEPRAVAIDHDRQLEREDLRLPADPCGVPGEGRARDPPDAGDADRERDPPGVSEDLDVLIPDSSDSCWDSSECGIWSEPR